MKQHDDIEKFIRDHREAFDEGEPDAGVWNRLEGSLFGNEEKKREKHAVIRRMSRSGKKWLSIAAVLLLCISFAAFIRTYQVKKETANMAIPSDLRDAQAYYEHSITTKIERIKSLSAEQNNRDTALWHLFGQRDAEYDRLRKDLQENPGNAHVRAAFVEYYRSRLEVLKGIEKHLEEKNK